MEYGQRYKDICYYLFKNENEKKDEVYLKQPKEGLWYEYTWGEVVHQARQIRTFLYEKGLKKGDRVSIISKNCAEWFMTDFAIALAGMVSVPVFPTQTDENIVYILDHAEVKLVFVGKLDEPERILKVIPSHTIKVNFDYHRLEADYQWSEVLQSPALEAFSLPEPEDIFSIIYSSGTTGTPKGVVFEHKAISKFLDCFLEDFKELAGTGKQYVASYLPLAHVYERTQLELASLVVPVEISFIESPELFLENLQYIKPTSFIAVPRIYGVIKEKIDTKIPPGLLSFLLRIPGVSTFIKQKIRKSLGLERAGLIVCGAAQLPKVIFDFFYKLGIPIQEGYGQTENMAYVAANKGEIITGGTVGKARVGVQFKLGEDNEILTYSDFLMKAYYKDPAKTKKAFTHEGWLKTGDTGLIDEQGRLMITGRLSYIFKNQKGEFINPVHIETIFPSPKYIENICLIGEGLSHNLLLVSLSALGQKAEKQDLEAALEAALLKLNQKLRSYEKVAHILITPESWTIENKLLTPTLKIKRKVLFEKFAPDVQDFAKQSSKIIWL